MIYSLYLTCYIFYSIINNFLIFLLKHWRLFLNISLVIDYLSHLTNVPTYPTSDKTWNPNILSVVWERFCFFLGLLYVWIGFKTAACVEWKLKIIRSIYACKYGYTSDWVTNHYTNKVKPCLSRQSN